MNLKIIKRKIKKITITINPDEQRRGGENGGKERGIRGKTTMMERKHGRQRGRNQITTNLRTLNDYYNTTLTEKR